MQSLENTLQRICYTIIVKKAEGRRQKAEGRRQKVHFFHNSQSLLLTPIASRLTPHPPSSFNVYRQNDSKSSAFTDFTFDLDIPLMFLDDAVAHGQAQSRARDLRLG